MVSAIERAAREAQSIQDVGVGFRDQAGDDDWACGNLDLDDARKVALAVVASLRADIASGDPVRVREAAEALGLTVEEWDIRDGQSILATRFVMAYAVLQEQHSCADRLKEHLSIAKLTGESDECDCCAEAILAAITAGGPAADAVLAALVQGGRLVEERSIPVVERCPGPGCVLPNGHMHLRGLGRLGPPRGARVAGGDVSGPTVIAAVRSISRESAGRWSLGCGDWITDEQAQDILAARGDDT